jgi:hypothetical protein
MKKATGFPSNIISIGYRSGTKRSAPHCKRA